MINEKGAVLIPLWDNIGVMQRGRTWEKDMSFTAPIDATTNYRLKKASKKRENERLQKIAEQLEGERNIDTMRHYALLCNASLRHLATVKSIIRYAQEHNEPIGLCTFKRRMKEEEIKAVWSLIRRWLSDKVGANEELAVAVTIGRNNKGWYCLRCISAGNSANDFIVDFAYYLRRKAWKNRAVVAVAESKELLRYYSSTDIDDYIDELFSVFRMSLMVDRRTYKNGKAVSIIEDSKLPVNEEVSYLVNAPMIKGNSNTGVAICYFEEDRKKVVFSSLLKEETAAKETTAML